MLENDERLNKYSISVKNKFSALGQFTTAEKRWQLMKQSMLESAKEHIPLKKRKVDKKWMTPQILDLMDGREEKSQGRRTEIQRTIQSHTIEKEVQ